MGDPTIDHGTMNRVEAINVSERPIVALQTRSDAPPDFSIHVSCDKREQLAHLCGTRTGLPHRAVRRYSVMSVQRKLVQGARYPEQLQKMVGR